jgi:hypothetical protein
VARRDQVRILGAAGLPQGTFLVPVQQELASSAKAMMSDEENNRNSLTGPED